MFYCLRKPKTTLQNSGLNGKNSKIEPLTITKTESETKTKTIRTNTKLRKAAETFITLIAHYLQQSNIHGAQYLAMKGLTSIEYCLWLTLLTISMYFCVQIGLESVDHYYTKSTVVGLERDFYYWNTTMPSITICPLKRLDNKLFNEYCRKHKLSAEDTQELFEFLENLANSTYTNFLNIPSNESIDLILDRLNIKPDNYMELIYNITGDPSFKFKSDLNHLHYTIRTTSGESLIETRQVLTEYGLCYMTNTMLSKEFTSSYLIWGEYPAYELSDLHSIIRVKESTYFDNDVSYNIMGFNISPTDAFLHSPYEIMRLDHNMGYSNYSIQVDVVCTEIMAEEGLEKDASVEQRKCRFQHESNLTHFPIYARNICQQECRINLVYKLCKCIPHFYPNRIKNPKPVCDYKILRECLVQHEHFLVKLYEVDSYGNKQIAPCYCAQNCKDSIINKRGVFQLEKANTLMGGNSLLVTMADSPTFRLKRQMIFSFTDLLVSIGGNAGLFLGFSVLCLVEVMYFGLRLFVHLIKACFKNDLHLESLQLRN